jgi:hypothetical protein
MGNDMSNDLVPSWDDIRNASDELDQMWVQTVMKACDVGDMLRAVRLTMEGESFVMHCMTELNRSKNWASQLMLLSHRRSAVIEALAEGKINDSIRSAYEYIKALPPSPEEEAERKQYPRAKRGPKTGSDNAGRPKATASSKSTPKQRAVSWQVIPKEMGALCEAPNAKQRREFQEQVQEIAPDFTFPKSGGLDAEQQDRLRSICRVMLDAQQAPAHTKAEVQQQKETLSQRKQREFDQLVQKEIARIRAVGNQELKEAMEKLRAEWQVKIDAASERERQKTAEHIRARQIREGLTAVMPVEVFEKLIRLLHPDRYPEELRPKVDEAVQILRRYVSPCLNREPKPLPKRTYVDATAAGRH